jgi:STIP1 family protein 1
MSLLSLSKKGSSEPQDPSAIPVLTPIQIENYEKVIADSLSSIRLHAENMKAYYFLAQAQIALHRPSEALASAKEAHRLCVEEIHKGGKGASSIGPITELVLRCKKEAWEAKEKERLDAQGGLVRELQVLLEKERDRRVEELHSQAATEMTDGEGVNVPVEEQKITEEYARKIEEVRNMGVAAGTVGEEGKRRNVPDWCIDDITFSVMVDPVVVRPIPPFSPSLYNISANSLYYLQTKTGQSYDRSSLMEHLKRTPTDPLTREPLRMEDLRPNLALKEACDEFLEQNGWAVDW